MDKRKAFWLLAAVAVGLLVLYRVNPTGSPFMPKCVFKLLTGWDCPGCGGQRTVHAFLHGRMAEAVHYNLFLLLAVPYAVALVVAHFVLHGEAAQSALRILESRPAVYTYVSLYFLWWIIRNILNI